MTDEALTAEDLAALTALDTPSVCNAIEIVMPERRAYGFTTSTLHCVRPELGSMVGHARTVTVRSTRPSALDAEEMRETRFGYYDYLAEADGPTIAIVQDLDDGQAGFGSFWGEVNSNIHKSLGCLWHGDQRQRARHRHAGRRFPGGRRRHRAEPRVYPPGRL